MNLSRRSLLGGIGALIVAPSIVRAGSLMPVKVLPHMAPQSFVGEPVFDGIRTLTLDEYVRYRAEVWRLVTRLCEMRNPWGRS